VERFYRELRPPTQWFRPKAKVALARKLLVRLDVMLRDQIDYEEFRRRGRAARAQPAAVLVT
jgi:hypothetical protein